MFNRYHGFKIAVIASPGGFHFVEVPPEQADDVRRLFLAHGIGHTVGNRRPGHDEDSDGLVIHIGNLWDQQQIQDALDSAP